MFTSFQQKNEIEKGKHPNGILIFTFWLESMNEFFDMRKYKFQKNLDRWKYDCKMYLRGICSFNGQRNLPREWFLDGEYFSTKRVSGRASVQKRLKRSTLNSGYAFLVGC